MKYRILILVVAMITAKLVLDILSPIITLIFGPLTAILASQMLWLLGYSSDVVGNTIFFTDIGFRIDALCTGIDTIVYFVIMVLCFFGFKDRKVNSMLIKYSIILFWLNIIRIAMFRPILVEYGMDKTYLVHNFIYNYAQGLVMLMAFAVLIIVRVYGPSGIARKQLQ